jgi:protein PET100
MSLYLTFPVVMFWISNQAEWFEDYVVQRKVGIKVLDG